MSLHTLRVNGETHQIEAPREMPLLWALRDLLHLYGTKYGCGIGVCGACVVHVDGKAVRACDVSIAEVAGKSVTTIEGLSKNGDHPLQKAWAEVDVSQCGYCQPGQIMSAAALLKSNPKPTDAEINEALDDNLCRCGAYVRIRKAIKLAAGIKESP